MKQTIAYFKYNEEFSMKKRQSGMIEDFTETVYNTLYASEEIFRTLYLEHQFMKYYVTMVFLSYASKKLYLKMQYIRLKTMTFKRA